MIRSLNPQNKPPDLISFDVFGDDSNLNALSPDTPGAYASEPAASAAPGGLPLDLFSSFSSAGPSAAPSKARQDPMAFFNAPQPMQPQSSGFQQASQNNFGMPSMQQPIQQQQQSASNNMFAGLDFGNSSSAASGSSTPSNGFGVGISLPLTPSNAGGAPANGSRQVTGQQPQAQPAAKKDPFADLANW